LFGLYDVLGSVGIAWEKFVSGKPGKPVFDVRIVAAQREPFHCANGVLVAPHLSIEDSQDADISIIASFVVPSLAPLKNKDDRELEWLARQQDHGSTIASACTGAIMLAESGMLDGWEATTHWAFSELFRVHYPAIHLRIEQDLCVSGQDNHIVTCGGATSWQEMALYLIARFGSVEHASNTAKFWRIPIHHDENQAAFAALTQGIPHDDGIVTDCQQWIAHYYANPNPISTMVQQSGLPPTTFARRFKRATGYRPMDYVHAIRIEEAKSMLEVSDNAVETIGLDIGYEDPASFRRIFKRKVGLTPGIYRRKFGRARFDRFNLPA
jgi:transcriptional regulator GlxA family with amidase domain